MKNQFIKVYNSPTFNTWASLLSRSLNIVVLIPFILKKFEPSEISLWYLFGTFGGFLFLFEFGFGPSFIRSISYALGGASSMKNSKGNGEPNYVFLKSIWQNLKTVYFILSITFVLILILFGTSLVYKPIQKLDIEINGWYAWFFSVLTFGFSFWGNIYSIFLQGNNKIAVFRRYEAVFSILSIISCAIGIQLGLSFLGLVILSQSWNIITVLRNLYICKKESFFVDINYKSFLKYDKELLKDLWATSWRSAIGMIMSYGIINSCTFYYAQKDDVKEVASFLFCYRILQILINFSMAPFYTKVPELSKLYVLDDKNKIIQTAKRGMLISHFAFIAATILIGVLAPFLLKFIGSNIGFIDQKLWFLFIIAFFIERYSAMHMQLYSVSNHIVWHIANSVTGGIMLVLLYFLLGEINFYAFPISIICSYLMFYTWYTLKKSYKLFDLNFLQYDFKIIIIPVLLIVFYGFYIFKFN